MSWLHFLSDPRQWRTRANEAQAHVGKITDPETRRIMLEIVDRYETLAQRAETGFVWDEMAKTGT